MINRLLESQYQGCSLGVFMVYQSLTLGDCVFVYNERTVSMLYIYHNEI